MKRKTKEKEEVKKLQPKDQWEKKFLQEQHFMPFGSMMNAFGLVNEGRGMALVEFLASSIKIFELAEEMADKSFERGKVEEPKEQKFEFPAQ